MVFGPFELFLIGKLQDRGPSRTGTLLTGDGVMENATIQLGSHASLHVYLPARPAAPLAAIIVPGGSYRPGPFGWCKTAEGSDVALQLAREGITGIVLHYRLPAGRPHVPLEDALRALEVVKTGSSSLPPMKAVGIIGFSAGGHLAALASTRYTSRAQRPAFTVLFYPVISMQNFTHTNSKLEYLGAQPSEALEVAYSADRQVTEDSPPSLLIHARDDRVVDPRSSRLYYDACDTHTVSSMLVELEAGGHPFVNKPKVWQSAWTVALLWMCSRLTQKGAYSMAMCANGASQTSSLRRQLLRVPGVAAVWQTHTAKSKSTYSGS